MHFVYKGEAIMKKKKILTSNLKPSMITAEAVYNFANHLIISSNTALTTDIIEKLKYYSVRSVKIFIPEEGEILSSEQSANAQTTLSETSSVKENPEMTYFEKIQASPEFKEFEHQYDISINDFKIELNDIIIKSSDDIIDTMLSQVDSIFSKARNPLHLIDMMQCMRSYDDLTYAHSVNVALICNIIGRWLKLSDNDLSTLITAGLLHDIGKLKISTDIIKKPGKLTDEEFQQIRNHTIYGYEILKTKNLDERVLNGALQHHERYNGKGYPHKLSGSEIDFFASIIAVADVFDAMTSDRSYRKGICPFYVLEQMEREKDTYEPSVLHTFVRHTAEAYVNNEVMLSTGEKGRVVLLNPSFLSRPVVVTKDNSYDLSKISDIQITALI